MQQAAGWYQHFYPSGGGLPTRAMPNGGGINGNGQPPVPIITPRADVYNSDGSNVLTSVSSSSLMLLWLEKNSLA